MLSRVAQAGLLIGNVVACGEKLAMPSQDVPKARSVGAPNETWVRANDMERIGFLRFYLVAALVFLHFDALYGTEWSPRDGYVGGDFPIASTLVSAVTFFAFAAVPTLSAISGFLFFRGSAPDAPPPFLRKWRGRIDTLVVPLVLWGALGVAMALVVHAIEPAFATEWFADGFGLLTLADLALGITRLPASGQLWFLRELILAVALAPIVWVAVSRVPIVSLALLTLLWVARADLVLFNRLEVLLFFSLGGALAIHGRRFDLTPAGTVTIGVVFLVLVLLRATAPGALGLDRQAWQVVLMTDALRVVGVIAVWSASAYLVRTRMGRIGVTLSPAAFFIFCSHLPLILFVKEAFGRLIEPQTDMAHLGVYFGSVATCFALIALAMAVLQRLAPGLLRILSGGRVA